MVDVLSVGRLIYEYTGQPAVLRWLSVHPDGRVVERTSDNLIGWSVQHEIWVQFLLVRDVYREVDPLSRGFGAVAALVRTDAHGSVVIAHDHRQRPANPVATAMLAAVGAVLDVNGTAAWLGAQNRQTGFHADLDRVDELRMLAAHCRSG